MVLLAKAYTIIMRTYCSDMLPTLWRGAESVLETLGRLGSRVDGEVVDLGAEPSPPSLGEGSGALRLFRAGGAGVVAGGSGAGEGLACSAALRAADRVVTLFSDMRMLAGRLPEMDKVVGAHLTRRQQRGR